MICKDCKNEFEENESVGSSFEQCQDCWEATTGEEWWETLTQLANDLLEDLRNTQIQEREWENET